MDDMKTQFKSVAPLGAQTIKRIKNKYSSGRTGKNLA